jgi:lantibiotic transport system permease protein
MKQTITTIINGIKAEYIKNQGTKLFWITLAIPMLVTFFAFIIMQNIPVNAAQKINGWERLTGATLSLSAFNILMMSLISIISLSVQTEYKANMWKHLLTLPIPNWVVFVSKYIFILLLILSVHILTITFLLLNGRLLSLTRPALNFNQFSPDLYAITWTFAKIFLSVLCVTAIQFWFSLRSKNYILPLFFGIFAVLVGTFATAFGWSKSPYIPYGYVALTNMFNEGQISESVYWGLPRFLWFSIVGFFIISFFAIYDATSRRVKA